ncbi:MAG: alpha-1,4-glucan--maltose-1-phosphate maltosyltransferase [Bacteroidetes bacterium]|nr:alpha-1,4-glucan--maltose-1-phosphate maltosyltransferase [Bacteroidota bacterium]
MISSAGKKRVIISNVLPSVDDGLFPAKTIINQKLNISADIFADGHDEIAASVLIKYSSEKLWKEYPLALVNNDHWIYSFVPEKIGTYQFQILAWIDAFASWKNGFEKKYNAGQEVDVELKIGVQIVEGALKNATGKNKAQLQQWLSLLNETEGIEEKGSLIKNNTITEALYKSKDKSRVTTYPRIFDITVERERAGFSTWYELFPRSASAEPGAHGTFSDVIKILPRISRMGFDVLYFPPIHPIGKVNRKGRNNSLKANDDDPGSPWAIGNEKGGHKEIHSQLGTIKDFKKLVQESKKYGLEVAMDIAFQCAPDHPYVLKHPSWFKWRPDGTVQHAENPPKKYEDILPFNFESEDWEGLWKELKSVIEYWIGTGVSIFRVDNPHTKAIPFWEWVIKEIKNQYPETIFLAEAFTRPRIMERLAKIGFTQSYTYFTWRHTKKELEEYVTELTQTNLKYYFRPNFWPNTPDILTPELAAGKENGHIIRLLLAATLSSSYGIYGPVYELNIDEPMPGKEEYIHNEKYEIKHWNWDFYTKTYEIISRINRIRKENASLHSTINIKFAETTNEQIICYVKYDEDYKNVLIIAVNLDPRNTHSANIKLPLLEGFEWDDNITVHDLLNGDKYHWKGDWNYVELNPYDMPAHVLRVAVNNTI